MLSLIDVNGNYYEAEHNITGALEVPKRPSPLHVWLNGEWVVDLSAQIEAARKVKLDIIVKERNVECESTISAHGRPWQADKRSTELLNNAITMASVGGMLPPVWRDANNSDMQITSLADLVAIATSIQQNVQLAYTRSWARKMVLQQASSLEDIVSI